jgi:hypothetical protein
MNDNLIDLKSQFPIENARAVSVRLFFARESEVDPIWHICDASMGEIRNAGMIYYMALHGSAIKPAVKCNTVEEAQARSGNLDQFCYRCLDEFQLAAQAIAEKRLTKFK